MLSMYHDGLINCTKNFVQTGKAPWKDIVKSRALHACIVAHMCNNWQLYTLLTSLPAFMKSVLKFDIKSVSIISILVIDKRQRIPRGQSNMDNPEKLAKKRQRIPKGAIKHGQSKQTGNIGYTRRRQTQHNMCWTPLCASKHK